MTSEQASSEIPEIDILHIDGNHQDAALLDVELYFPKVKSGGYIWFDDIKSSNVQKKKKATIALESILPECEIIEYVDNGICILIRKN